MKCIPQCLNMNQRKFLKKTKKSKETMPCVGVAWYSSEQAWAEMKKTALDPERYEESYSAWASMAEESLANLRAARIYPVKVDINPGEFSFWCLQNSRSNNASTRADFAAEKMRQADLFEITG